VSYLTLFSSAVDQDAVSSGEQANMRSEECRRHAAECLRLAENATDAEDRQLLLDMAMSWLLLAHEPEGNQPKKE
jgi:hypothetical protein